MSALDLTQRFLDMSADYWRENTDMCAIFTAQASELDHAQYLITEQLYNELYVDTATTWGLSYFEERYGLDDTVERTLEERRGRIRAAKRGANVTSIQDLERIAGAFAGGTVSITIDHDAFRVDVTFVDQRGVPTRIQDVQDAINAVMPAYYAIVYDYRYNTYGKVKQLFGTYGELDDSRITYAQLLLADQEAPSAVDFRSQLILEFERYLDEAKSPLLNASYLNYQGLN